MSASACSFSENGAFESRWRWRGALDAGSEGETSGQTTTTAGEDGESDGGDGDGDGDGEPARFRRRAPKIPISTSSCVIRKSGQCSPTGSSNPTRKPSRCSCARACSKVRVWCHRCRLGSTLPQPLRLFLSAKRELGSADQRRAVATTDGQWRRTLSLAVRHPRPEMHASAAAAGRPRDRRRYRRCHGRRAARARRRSPRRDRVRVGARRSRVADHRRIRTDLARHHLRRRVRSQPRSRATKSWRPTKTWVGSPTSRPRSIWPTRPSRRTGTDKASRACC